jgi:uncharacterized membrane protein
VFILLVLFAQSGADPGARDTADDRALQSAAQQRAECRSASAANQCTFARSYTPVPVSIVAMVSIVVIVVALVVVAAVTSFAQSFIKIAPVLRTKVEAGGRYKHRKQQRKPCP